MQTWKDNCGYCKVGIVTMLRLYSSCQILISIQPHNFLLGCHNYVSEDIDYTLLSFSREYLINTRIQLEILTHCELPMFTCCPCNPTGARV